jgi:heat shock protein HslJ
MPLAIAALLGGCAAPQQRPAPLYRAQGTEPFWGLVIDEHDVTFTQPDAQPIRQPTPRVIIGFAGEIYQTPRINVNIVHGSCSDGMSDRVHRDKVQVTVDGRRFDGCGGP